MSVWNDIKGMWRSGGVLLRLIIINVAVFLGLLLLQLGMIMVTGDFASAKAWMKDNALTWLQSTSILSELPFRIWTVGTYMFTHIDLGHAFFNMLMLWFAGRSFMNVLGERRLLGTYLLGGVLGFALFLLFANVPVLTAYTSGGTIIGASASVLAILIFIATHSPENEMRVLLFAIRLKWLAAILLLLDLVSIRDGDNTGGHIAHLGGALYGYLAATQLKKGNDWSLGFINGLERIGKALTFRRGPRLKVVQSPRGKRMSDADYNATRKAEQANIDVILDKISRSGYESLSKTEKDILFKASNDGKR